jgi:peptidoglycan hydrolase-like protein with peptidoglycan-binding domain
MKSHVRGLFFSGLVLGAFGAMTLVSAPSASAAVSCSTYSRYYNTSGTTHANMPSTSSSGGFNCTLGTGNAGSGVRALQRTLNYCYSAGLTVDGAFGNATKSALQGAQRAAGVSQDGVYGPNTRNAILHAYFRTDGTSDGGAFFTCGRY